MYKSRIAGPGTTFVLPQSVDNVLNAVQPGMRLHVLKWIMNDGLSLALVHRKNLAKEVSAKYGFDIRQDAIFSNVAHQQIDELGKRANEIEQLWFKSGYEPEEIPIYERSNDADKSAYLNLQDINSSLMKFGMQPFHFGGKDGFIEYMERGEWNKSPYRKRNAEFNKQGHDLSLHDKLPCPNKDESGHHLPNCSKCDGTGWVEDTGEYQDEAGRKFYQFGLAPGDGGYRPPTGTKAYYTAIHRSQKRSAEKMAQFVDAAKAGESLGPGLEWLEKIIKTHKPDNPSYNITSKQVPLHQSVGLGLREKEVDNDEDTKVQISEEDYPLLKQLVAAAIDDGLDTDIETKKVISLKSPKGVQVTIGGIPIDPNYTNQETRNSIMRLFFDDNNRTLRREVRKVWTPGPQSGLKYPAHTLILAGVKLKMEELKKTLPADKAKEKGDELYKRAMTYVDILKGGIRMPLTSQGQIHPVDIDNLISQGWEPKNLKPEEEAGLRAGLPLSKAIKNTKVINLYHQMDGLYKKLIKGEHGWGEVKKIESEPVDIAQLKNQGYQFRSLNSPINTIGKVSKGEEEFIIRKGNNDQWYRSQIGKESKLSQPMLGHTKLSGNIGLQTHIDPGMDQDKIFDYWQSHPEEFGSSEQGGDPWVGGFPQSIRSAIPDNKAEYRNDALQKIAALFGDVRFKYGDLKYKNLSTSLGQLTQQLSENPELVQKLIDNFSTIMNEKGDVQWHNGGNLYDENKKTFRRDVYEEFIANGFNWRYRIARSVGKYGGKEAYRPDRARGGNVQGKEGEFDPQANLTRDRAGKTSDDDGGGWGGVSDDDDDSIRTKYDYRGNDDSEEPENFDGTQSDDTAGDVADQWLKSQQQSVTKKKSPPGKPIGRRLKRPSVQWKSQDVFPKEPAQPQEPTMSPPQPTIKPNVTQADPIGTFVQAARGVPPDDNNIEYPKFIKPRLQNNISSNDDIEHPKFPQREHVLNGFLSYFQWREMMETGIVWGYSRKKAKLNPGSGFNLWGEPGSTGTSIGGEVDTVKEDPDGTKGVIHGRKCKT